MVADSSHLAPQRCKCSGTNNRIVQHTIPRKQQNLNPMPAKVEEEPSNRFFLCIIATSLRCMLAMDRFWLIFCWKLVVNPTAPQKSTCLYPSACSKTVTNQFRIRGVLAKEQSFMGFPVWFTFLAVTSQCIESAASMQAQFESFTNEEDGKDRRHGCHHPFH